MTFIFLNPLAIFCPTNIMVSCNMQRLTFTKCLLYTVIKLPELIGIKVHASNGCKVIDFKRKHNSIPDKVIVRHIFEASIKCLCFILSE